MRRSILPLLALLFGYTGMGQYVEVPSALTATPATHYVDVADIDGDGDDDLALTALNGALILENEHDNPSATNLFDVVPGGFYSQSTGIQFIKILDGEVYDLVVSEPDKINILINDGDGNFSLSFNVATVGTKEIATIETADLNHDGKMDIIASTSAGIVWFKNESTGNTRAFAATDLSSISTNTSPLAPLGQDLNFTQASDLDGDGDLDIVASTTSSTQNLLLECTSSNPLAYDVYGYTLKTEASMRTAIADVDEDGHLDIVTSYLSSSVTNTISFGNGAPLSGGSGAFTELD